MALVENALNKVMLSTDALIHRDPEAVKAVMEGLMIAGIAMNYAGISRPDHEKAIRYAASFSLEAWNRKLLAFIGPGANAMIAGENKEHKYDTDKHARRLKIIEERWDDITNIIAEMPHATEIRALMESIGLPVSASCIGYTSDQVRTTFTMTKDIRDKYVGTRLFWDLGILDEIAEDTF